MPALNDYRLTIVVMAGAGLLLVLQLAAFALSLIALLGLFLSTASRWV